MQENIGKNTVDTIRYRCKKVCAFCGQLLFRFEDINPVFVKEGMCEECKEKEASGVLFPGGDS